MENKQSKRRWKIPVLLVSAICILLASSFVFHIAAEASVLTYSLQGASFGYPVLDDGSVSSVGLDRTLIDNYSVSSQNQFVATTQENFTLTGNVYSAASKRPVPVWDCSSIYAAYQLSLGSSAFKLYTSNGVVDKTYSHFPQLFFSDKYLSGLSVYDLEGFLIGSFPFGSSVNILGCYLRNGKYILFTRLNSTYSIKVCDSDFSILYNKDVSTTTSYPPERFYCTDKYALWFKLSTIYILDLETFTYSSKTNGSGRYSGYMTQLGDHLYSLSDNYLGVFDLELNFLFEYIVSNLGAIESTPVFNSFGGAFIIDNSSSSYTIASFPNQYYANFSAHFVDSFTPSKWINFSCKPSTDGSVVGGDAVGIKLDYALSDEYLSTVYTYGVKVSGCTILASLDDLSTGIGYYGLPPLVVKVNGSAVPRITKEYESVEKVGDVYLYVFSAFCDFQGSAKISSLEIYMNCFVPKQLSRHSFSLPVSGVELYLEPAGGGGGGGESSDASSGGGGGTSSDSSSGGTSSEDHPSDMPPEWERNSVEFWFKNQTQDFFLGTYDMWDADTLQVYFGGYAVGSMEPVPTRIRFLKNDVVTEEIRFENLVFQGWSYSSSLTSFEYPTFSGCFVTVPLDSSRRIYLTDYLSNPQLFIADYGAGMLALVNFDSTDSYLTVVNSETLETTITVNNSTVESMIIYGKVMEYSFFTLSEYISWQPYEEGGVYIHANDWDLYDDVYAGLYLHTYITETPPPTVDWWVEYSMELESERSRLAELESKANQLYGDVSFDPLDDADFVDAISSYTGVIATDAADGVFSLIQKMWSANPYFTYFVAITVGISCCMFYLRKL